MEGKAVVLKIDENEYLIETIPDVDCASCLTRGQGKCHKPGKMHRKFLVANNFQANVGDIIFYTIPSVLFLNMLALVFFVPISSIVAGVFLFRLPPLQFTSSLDIQMMIGGGLGLLFSFIFLALRAQTSTIKRMDLEIKRIIPPPSKPPM